MVQSFFIQNLIDEIESGSAYCKVVSQEELKEYLINTGECDNFPMISYEYTEDSNIDVGIDESKFLNDKEYTKGVWIQIFNENTGEDSAILHIVENNHIRDIKISVMEVSTQERGNGLGSKIIDAIIDSATERFETISCSPFDTNAMNFWSSMDFMVTDNYNYIYKLD